MDAVWLLCVAATWLTGVTGQGIVIEGVRLIFNGVAGGDRGRVEVLADGAWGTVCDDGWDNLDAAVVCRQLGFENGGVATRNASFGQGTGEVLIDDVGCDGSEVSIGDCTMTTITNCLHNEDAGVICNPNPVNPVTATTTTAPPPTVAPVPDNCNPSSPATNVRLVNNNTRAGIGIVEVRNGGTWGSVCDDYFDENAARVVCRTLCFNPANARAGASSDVGQARLPIILDDVRCGGNEAQIQDCRHATWNTNNCATQEVAKVTCVPLNFQAPLPPAPVLECRDGFLIAAFSKARDPLLEPKHLTVPNAGTPCDLKYNTDNNTVVIRIPFDQCGTNVTRNATHLVYFNVINYAATRLEGSITRVNTYLVEVFCEMPKNVAVTRPIEPQTVVVTQKSTGRFRVTMSFFRNDSFNDPVTETPLRLPLGEWLNIALQLESIDSRLKLVVPDCVATPTNDINNPINYPLFTNSCREEPTLTFFNLNQTRFGYRYQPFMFVNYPEVYLHCGAFVCLLEENTAQCDRSCNSSKPQPTTSRRRKRDAGTDSPFTDSPWTDSPSDEKIMVHSGPLVIYKLDNSMTIVERIGKPETFTTEFTVPISTPTTPPPAATHRVGTSVRVQHESTTITTTDEISGSGDSENQFTTSTSKPTTKNDVTTHRADVTTHKANVTTHKVDVTTPKTDVTTHRADVTTHKVDVTTHKVDVTTHKVDVTTHKADVTTQKVDVTTHKVDVTTHKADVTTKSDDVTPKTEVVNQSTRSVITTTKKDVTTHKPAITTKAEEFTKQVSTPIMSTPVDTSGGFFVERGVNPNRPSSAQNQKSGILRGFVPAFTSGSPLHIPSVSVICMFVFVVMFIRI